MNWDKIKSVPSYFVGLGEAVNLAQTLCKFPQECLRADRRSAYYATYDAKSHEDALDFEFENGVKVVQNESIPG